MPKQQQLTIIFFVTLCGLLLPLSALAETEGQTQFPYCQPMPAPDITPTPNDQVEIEAQQAEIQGDGKSRLQGDVQVRQGQRTMQAGEAIYDANKQLVELHGQVIYQDPNVRIESEGLSYNTQTQSGEFGESEYMLFSRHLRGMAQRIVQQDANTTVITGLTFSTCDKGDDAWRFKSRELVIDSERQQGVARDSVLYIQNIPVLYLPYVRFPTSDNRITGFLAPTMSYNGSDRNLSIGLPFYWNLAPNYDATLTPVFMSRRGFLLGTEFRYLTGRSEGDLNFEYLNYDPLYGDMRWYGSYQHLTHINPRWTMSLDINGISDADYLLDTERGYNGLEPYFKRELLINYTDNNYLFDLRLLSHQVLSGTGPDAQLPSIRYRSDYHRRPNAFYTGFDLRFDNFYNASTNTEADRSHLQWSLDYEHSSAAGYWRPAVTGYMTYFNVISPAPQTANRIVPAFSFDSGLFLERQTRLFNRAMTQTLEPRLYYAYVPYVDQSALPLPYDTVVTDIDFGSLFRLNRYNGIDRIGDTHHIALGITSRFLGNHNGREYLRFSIGQIFYLADRQVLLPGEVGTTATSELVGEFELGLNEGWRLISNAWWDPAQSYSRQGNSRLQYRGRRDEVFNIEYRYLYQSVGTPDSRIFAISGIAPVSPQRHLYGYANYDPDFQGTRDIYIGMGYDSCCWSSRVFMRRYYTDISASANTGIYFEFVLKGLAGVGEDKTDTLLQTSIPGYTAKQ